MLVAQSCPTLWDPMVSLWNSPYKNTGVDRHSPLQEIFPNQGSNLGLLHCRQIFLPTKLPGKPREATNLTLIRSFS